MRKVFLLFGLLTMVSVLFVACNDELDPTSPEEAAFKGGKVENECSGTPLALLDEIDETIDTVLEHRNSKKGAHQIVDNIARKVCADPPQYMATGNMVDDFHALLLQQPTDELVGGWDAAAELLAQVTFFATNVELLDLPVETLIDGGFGVVTPGIAKTILADNSEAALVADATSFPDATGPVVVYFYRTPDPVPGTPDYPIPGYQAYPEAWDFSGTAQPTGGVDFWMCVVEDELPVPFDRLLIGHALDGGGAELLTPRLVDNSPLDCSGAVYQPPIVSALPGTPAWLLNAGTLLEPVMSRILAVKPLHAMYFAGRGLGGRGDAFSPFSPVDALYELTLGISDGFGTLEIGGTPYCGAAPTATFCGPYYAEPNTAVYITATPALGYEVLWTGCSDFDGNICEVLMASDRTVSAEFTALAPSTQIAFVSGQDLWLMDADGSNFFNITNDGGAPLSDRGPTWSPDGQRLAFYRLEGGGIFIINADGTGLTGPIGSTGAFWPAWSPLGDRIAYVDSGIWTMNVDGSDPVQVVSAATTSGGVPAWSPDGTQLAYTFSGDIWVVNTDGTGATNITNSASSDRSPAWSPLGNKIAFTRDVAGVEDIYTINADGSGTPVNVTNTAEPDVQVDWSADGSMLTYWSIPAGGGNDQIFIKAADGSGSAAQLTFPPDQPGYSSFDPVWRPPVYVEPPM